MIETTEEVREAVKQNIEKCISYLKKNALENDTVWVDYGAEYKPDKKSERLRITKDSVQSGNNWGYHTHWRDLDKMRIDEQMVVLKRWEEIKIGFEKEKRRILDNDEADRKLIFEFQV